MKWSDFPVLASWLDKAKGFVGTRGYAAPVGCELESLTAATTGAAVIFKPTTTVGRVQVKGSIMHDRQPRVVSDYIAEVMGKNPHVPIFQFTLSPKDQEDLELSITCRLPTDSNGTVKLHVGDDQSGDVLFARRRPTSKKLGKDNYLLPQPTTHTLRFLSLKDAHRQIPIYSLPTSKQLQCKPDDRFGLTTPTKMSTTDAEPFLPFPMCHPLPFIGSNEKVVPGPATGTARKENPNAISDFGLCRYRGIFADSPVHSAAKDECLTIPGQKWGSIFNDNAPAPGRAQDSPGRSACCSRLGLPLPDGEGNDLPALEALAKEVQWEIQKVKDFEDVVVVRASYVRATSNKRQHWHRDRPLTHKIKGHPFQYLCRAMWTTRPTPLVVDTCHCPMRGCLSPGSSARWIWRLWRIANYELRTTNCKIAQNTVLSLSLCKACQGTEWLAIGARGVGGGFTARRGAGRGFQRWKGGGSSAGRGGSSAGRGGVPALEGGSSGGSSRGSSASRGFHVPFVNGPFESEIHGTVNFTQFCCVLLVTWCYRVLLSCYLRPK